MSDGDGDDIIVTSNVGDVFIEALRRLHNQQNVDSEGVESDNVTSKSGRVIGIVNLKEES